MEDSSSGAGVIHSRSEGTRGYAGIVDRDPVMRRKYVVGSEDILRRSVGAVEGVHSKTIAGGLNGNEDGVARCYERRTVVGGTHIVEVYAGRPLYSVQSLSSNGVIGSVLSVACKGSSLREYVCRSESEEAKHSRKQKSTGAFSNR